LGKREIGTERKNRSEGRTSRFYYSATSSTLGGLVRESEPELTLKAKGEGGTAFGKTRQLDLQIAFSTENGGRGSHSNLLHGLFLTSNRRDTFERVEKKELRGNRLTAEGGATKKARRRGECSPTKSDNSNKATPTQPRCYAQKLSSIKERRPGKGRESWAVFPTPQARTRALVKKKATAAKTGQGRRDVAGEPCREKALHDGRNELLYV